MFLTAGAGAGCMEARLGYSCRYYRNKGEPDSLHERDTGQGAKIRGDSEDLAFAEASVLQNILTKYYMRFGFTAYNAAAKAQSMIFLLAERDYPDNISENSHLYVAFVTEPRGTSGATIMLLEPQNGFITPPAPFESVLNDKYLFYANSSKISAISFYDWSALRLSASVTGASTLQQAIDAVNGVRPASDFNFSEKAQKYIEVLQGKARNLVDAKAQAKTAEMKQLLIRLPKYRNCGAS